MKIQFSRPRKHLAPGCATVTLVLLCEVLPIDQLDRIIDVSRRVLTAGIGALSGTDKHRQAIETLRFLKDGFHSRLEDVPHDIRALATQFIECQFERETLEGRLSTYLEDSPNDIRTLVQIVRNHLASETLRNNLVNNPPDDVVELVRRIKSQLADGDEDVELIEQLEKSPTDTKKLLELVKNQLAEANLLDQKRAVESIILADEQSMPTLLETALNVDSDWVQETALRSCRVLTTPSEQILRAIRRRLNRKYVDLELFRDFSFYRVLFSSPASFAPLLHYTLILGISGFVTVALYVLLGLFYLMTIGLLPFIIFSSAIWMIYYIFKRDTAPKSPVFTIFYLLVMSFFLTANRESDWITNESIAWFLILICLNVLTTYLVVNYPSTPSDWGLLPFTIGIGILKWIVEAIKSIVGKLGWGKLVLSIAIAIVLVTIFGGVFIGIVSAFIQALIVLRTCKFSLQCLYGTYHPIVATLVVFIVAGFLAAMLPIIRDFINLLWTAIREPTLLRYHSLNPSARPVSAIEAVKRLRTFSAYSVKVQYIRALRNWLPISSEWHIFIEEANRHKGVVRDELYKLAELWQDSETGGG